MMKLARIASCLVLAACSGASSGTLFAFEPIDSGADVSTADAAIADVEHTDAADDVRVGDAAVDTAPIVDGGTGALGDPCDAFADCKPIDGAVVGCETFHEETAGGDPWHRCTFSCALAEPSPSRDLCEQTLGLHCDVPQGATGGGLSGDCLP